MRSVTAEALDDGGTVLQSGEEPIEMGLTGCAGVALGIGMSHMVANMTTVTVA